MDEHRSAAGEQLTGRLHGVSDESPLRIDDGPVFGDSLEALSESSETKRFFRWMAVGLIFVFWCFHFVALSLDRLVRGSDIEGSPALLARAVVTLFAIGFSFVIHRILQRRTSAAFLRRALLAVGLALVGATFHTVVNLLAFWLLLGQTVVFSEGPSLTSALQAMAIVNVFLWPYVAITVLLLSITYGEDLLDRERLISQLSSESQRARLKALRYQLNPHFLFNALNSIVSLIASRRNHDAELMVVNLGDFLRATLALAPAQEIRLEEELALQSLYLDVEKLRFPDRLRVTTSVPDEAMDVLVPNLITQPLIENTIKHAVAASSTPVHLEISARCVGQSLRIEIRDDGGNATSGSSAGANLGIKNVGKRLKLHFGEAATFQAGATAEGGFASTLLIPIRKVA